MALRLGGSGGCGGNTSGVLAGEGDDKETIT